MATTSLWRYQIEDVPDLRFHEYHGSNICLLNDRRRALRRVSFEKSVVFSERPLKPFELFLVSIERTEGGWSGHLRLGVSRLNPNLKPDLEEGSHNHQAFLADSWMVAVSNTASGEFSSLPTDVGSLIGVYYEPINAKQAQLHLLLNGEDFQPQVGVIPIKDPLYAIVDVYGTTKQISIVPMVRTVQRLSRLCELRIHDLISHEELSPDYLPLPNSLKFLVFTSYQESRPHDKIYMTK